MRRRLIPARTAIEASCWLEENYKEKFFLYVDFSTDATVPLIPCKHINKKHETDKLPVLELEKQYV